MVLIIMAGFFSCSGYEKDMKLKVHQYRIPVLRQKHNNPVLELTLMPSDTAERTIREVTISLDGTTDISDIKAVRLFIGKKLAAFSIEKQFGTDLPPAKVVTFNDRVIIKDTVSMWVSVCLNDSADLLHKISANCISIATSAGRLEQDTTFKPRELRIGIALRQHMDDSVHTFRIPGLTTTNKGALLAIYDIRRKSGRDLQGDIDIGLSRSVDGGNTWGNMQVVLDMDTWGDLPQKFNGVSDANILVDRKTGNIFISGLWMHGVLDKNGKWIEGLSDTSDAWEHQWRNKGSQPGFGVKETSQFIITESTDDGLTWSEPQNITRMGKKREWWLWAPAPGHGITLDDGTLIIPTQGRDETGMPFSCITWSKDGGVSWTTSNQAFKNTTECMAVQLSDGTIMLNMRYNPNRNNMADDNGRAVAVTNDLGTRWVEHPSSRNALIEPTCMGSIHRHEYMSGGTRKSILLFSNPDSKNSRTRMTIKVSFDDGRTWPRENWLLLDELKSNGYSCLTSIDENTIGILYEGSQSMLTFEKIPLSELIR